jgi:hypothetical protein
VAYFKVLSQHFPGGTKEYHENTDVRTVGVLPEVRVGCIRNKNHTFFLVSWGGVRLSPLGTWANH